MFEPALIFIFAVRMLNEWVFPVQKPWCQYITE